MQNILAYRELQVLNRVMNSILLTKVTPTMVSVAPAIQVFGQYVCIMLHKEIPYPQFILFPVTVWNSFACNMFFLSFASAMFGRSERVLKRMRGLSANKKIRRKVRASWELRLKFGSNYVDQGTPLVIQDFCILQTVNLILMSAAGKRRERLI